MPIKINGTNTAANPSITGSDTDTGIVYGSDQIDFSIGGSSKVFLNSSGNQLFTGNAVISVDSNSSNLYLGGGSNQPSEAYLESGTFTAYKVNGSERMRIDSAGNVGIGTSSITANTNYNTLQIQGQSGNGGAILRLQTTDGSTSKSMIFADTGGLSLRQETNHPIVFGTNNTDRMRVDSGGAVRIGNSLTSGAAGKLQVVEESCTGQANDCNVYFETNAIDWNLKMYYNTTGTHYHIVFLEQGSTRGSITGSDGSNVTYNQGSDYRWKENIVDMTGSEGIEICKKLKPRKYNWIENREVTGKINTVDGFIAHEVEEAGVLGAVTGVKDAVNEDGSINGQMLDYGQMTPVLAAAIKGLIAKVETLETKVAALEAA